MKKRILIGTSTIIILAAGFLSFCLWFLTGAGSSYYYTRIDNSNVEQIDSRKGVVDFQGGMPYSYTLPAYDEKGGEKEITFGASRELTEGAYICLTFIPVRGVTQWSEVQYEELPAAVQSRLPGPSNP